LNGRLRVWGPCALILINVAAATHGHAGGHAMPNTLMNIRPTPTFAFTPNEAATLMDVLERRDIAASAFVSDCEDCLHAFDCGSSGATTNGMPTVIMQHLQTITAATAELRGALYALPEDIKMLIDLHLLSDGARRRIAQDMSQLVEPLEDLASGVAEIQKYAAGEREGGRGRLEDRLVLALAGAYRNRLNRKATADEASGFPHALATILGFAGQRVSSVSACRGAITNARLRRLLAQPA